MLGDFYLILIKILELEYRYTSSKIDIYGK